MVVAVRRDAGDPDGGASAASVDAGMLAGVSLFRDVDMAVVAPLLRTSEIRELAQGETLIEAGRPNDTLFILLEGRLSVRLKSPDSHPLALIEAGETVGELSLIDRQPTSAMVVAEVDCRVLALDESLLWILINTSHAVSGNLLFTVVTRLRAGNEIVWESRERAEQYRFHATVDALTGLFNRHWLSQMLPRQMHRAEHSGSDLALIMLDIDHFKAYNDRHGHPAGDQVLRSVAETLRTCIRPADMAARYGGEELLVVLPECDVAGARIVAERVREALLETRIVSFCGNSLPPVSASFGIAERRDGMTLQAFVQGCDEALYRAKAAGRDRVSD